MLKKFCAFGAPARGGWHRAMMKYIVGKYNKCSLMVTVRRRRLIFLGSFTNNTSISSIETNMDSRNSKSHLIANFKIKSHPRDFSKKWKVPGFTLQYFYFFRRPSAGWKKNPCVPGVYLRDPLSDDSGGEVLEISAYSGVQAWAWKAWRWNLASGSGVIVDAFTRECGEVFWICADAVVEARFASAP